eukprot:scaffold378_cov270-Chaetoceros_neogracile.AAC.23
MDKLSPPNLRNETPSAGRRYSTVIIFKFPTSEFGLDQPSQNPGGWDTLRYSIVTLVASEVLFATKGAAENKVAIIDFILLQ